jgi:predicted  nucleic acid-binding Zn-ribbon protein
MELIMDRGSEMKAAMQNEIKELKKRRFLLSNKMGKLSQNNRWNTFEHEIDKVISELESDYEIIIRHMEEMGT